MNDLLQLKGRFLSRTNTQTGGPLHLKKGTQVTSEHIHNLKNQLEDILNYWKNDTKVGGALVSVHYRQVVAKSNRLKYLVTEHNESPNDSIRGAKFVTESSKESKEPIQKHVFTHFVSLEAIEKSIHVLSICENIVKTEYNGVITDKDTESINNGNYHNNQLKRTIFIKIIVDAYYVDYFDIDKATKKTDESSIVTLYKTNVETKQLLKSFGINIINSKMIDETTLILDSREMDLLLNQAPYLVAMEIKDFSKMTKDDFIQVNDEGLITIPKPHNEPVIGVIDTHFDTNVYFSEWVEYENRLDTIFDITNEDKFHGTAVSSIIVDGPSLNPQLDDECGRFRVKHFGVAMARGFSSFSILKMIRNIVAENRNIKVWNLSLGSAMEIDLNFISPEAAELDKIQNEYDVIFVVAGTNKGRSKQESMRIGAPADSLNSLVVNSVDFENKSASYSREGPVLSFFYKPDVSYYGGDKNERITVCEPLGQAHVIGTSFAAPWITRKVAYLIYIMGMSREVAKALIIDSAAKWDNRSEDSNKIGYGIVPIKISEILQCRDDEIRFIMNGTIEEYETYTYSLPVPQHMNAHPYNAKATLVYFPQNDRNQGVDYTSTEMDIHFGRLKEQNGKVSIKSIDFNPQDEQKSFIYEKDARKMYRKWDNVKHINEVIKTRSLPRKVYESGLWGLSIKTKERLHSQAGRGLKFGIVITLREMNGVNRIDDFIKLCIAKGWIVNKINIQNQFDVYNKAEEEIEFE